MELGDSSKVGKTHRKIGESKIEYIFIYDFLLSLKSNNNMSGVVQVFLDC